MGFLAQEAAAQVRTIEVGTLRFEGNESFGDVILEDLIQTRESSGSHVKRAKKITRFAMKNR